MILYLTMSIIQGLVQKENVGALQDTRNCFVYVAWFPMLMIICIFAKAGVIIVWGLLKIMRLMILKKFFVKIVVGVLVKDPVLKVTKLKS